MILFPRHLAALIILPNIVGAVLLPIGTTEQHGRHMPLDTDCVIARALCDRAARAATAEDLDVLIAPTLNVTLSWYHMQFPGSLRLRTDTFLRVFEEVCESLHHHGLHNLIAVNGLSLTRMARALAA